MAITSLNNIGIPTTNAADSTQVLLMPKLKYRFRVTLLGFGVAAATELTKQVQDVTRPKVSFEEMTLDVYNSKVKLAGRHALEPVTLTLRDDASGQVQKLVGQQIQKQFDFMEQASARSGIDYKFTTRIEVLDGGNGLLVPSTLETFELYGCFIQNADYGDANYSTNEHMTVALSIVYDNLSQFAAGAAGVGVGSAINQLNDQVAMVAAVRSLVEALSSKQVALR
jgi:hypothetical protein